VIDLTTHKNNIRQKKVIEEAPVAGGDKKMVKCKHWPKCRESDETCPFVHPKDNCKYFPFCKQGDKCLYIHPEVKSHFKLFRSPASSPWHATIQHATTSTRLAQWAPLEALRGFSKLWA